jgi:hypothetical protein
MNTELLPYRLKSARRKKRLQKQDLDKQLLQTERRLKELTGSAEVIIEQLDKPYQKGWKRLFVLKKAAAQSENAAFYQEILDKINTVQYHYDESFKSRKKGKRQHRGHYDKLPALRSVNKYDWNAGKLNLTDVQKACFALVSYWNEPYCRWENYYEFTQPWLFEIKVLPHMIYEVRVSDALLAQEESFLSDYLYTGKASNRLAKIHGGRHKYWRSRYYTEKTKYINLLKNKQVCDVLEEHL